MIELRTPYGSFDLAPDTEISLVEVNNALDWDADFNTERSYPATLPWTPTNAGIWLHADEPDGYDTLVSMQCDLIVNGSIEFRGRIYLLQTERKRSYSVSLALDKTVVNPDLTLQEITWETDYTDFVVDDVHESTDTLGDIVDGNARYALPVINQIHTSSLGSSMHLNYWDKAIPAYQYWGNLAPQLFLHHVLARIAYTYNLKLTGCFDTDAELRKLLILSMWNAPTVNVISATMGSAVKIRAAINPALLLPKITVRELVSDLRVRFGLGCYVDAVDGMMLYSLRDLLQNRKEIDITEYVAGYGVQEISPEVTEGVMYNTPFDNQDAQNEWCVEFNSAKVKGTVATTVALLAVTGMVDGDVYLVEDGQRYWRYDSDAPTWVRYMWRYLPKYKAGDGKRSIAFTSGSVVTEMIYDPRNTIEWIVPHTEYDTDNVDNNVVEADLRYMIYHGMRDSKLAGGLTPDYPYASIHNIDSNAVEIGDMDLRDVDDFGLNERYRKYRIRANEAQKRPIVYLKNCDEILRRLTPDTLLRIKNNLYMWVEKTPTYTQRGLDSVELKLLKV